MRKYVKGLGGQKHTGVRGRDWRAVEAVAGLGGEKPLEMGEESRGTRGGPAEDPREPRGAHEEHTRASPKQVACSAFAPPWRQGSCPGYAPTFLQALAMSRRNTVCGRQWAGSGRG